MSLPGPIRAGLVATKLAITSGILLWAMGHIDLAGVKDGVTRLPPWAGAAAVLLLGLQFVIAGVRQRAVLEMNGERIPFRQSLNIVMIGAFFSQAMISFIGGDAMRFWYLKRNGMRMRAAAKALIIDRVLGFLALLALVLAFLPATIDLLDQPHSQAGLGIIVLCGVAAAGAFFALGTWPLKVNGGRFREVFFELMAAASQLLSSPRLGVRAFAQSVLIQVASIVALYLLGSGLGLGAPLFDYFALVPAVMLITMLPISIAGWGVREGAMLVAFHYLGVPPERIVLTSVYFGLATLVLSLTGGVIWMLHATRGRPE